MLIRIFFYLVALFVASHAVADNPPSAVYYSVPNISMVGTGRYSVYLWDVYDATLYASNSSWYADKPFALSLTYLRDIKGKQIAKASIDRIKRQGVSNKEQLNSWANKMRELFPDVTEGSTITGFVNDKRESVFYFDEQELGRIRDPRFTRYFFNIWLGADTEAPELREELLGLK